MGVVNADQHGIIVDRYCFRESEELIFSLLALVTRFNANCCNIEISDLNDEQHDVATLVTCLISVHKLGPEDQPHIPRQLAGPLKDLFATVKKLLAEFGVEAISKSFPHKIMRDGDQLVGNGVPIDDFEIYYGDARTFRVIWHGEEEDEDERDSAKEIGFFLRSIISGETQILADAVLFSEIDGDDLLSIYRAASAILEWEISLGNTTKTVAADAVERRRQDPLTDARDKWVYEQVVSLEPYKNILRTLESMCAPNQWSPITTENGLLNRAQAYAKRYQLPAPAPRTVRKRKPQ